ncbi:hypothetical protein B0H17DRAFT_1053590 [Mycena rosella]|uniref:Uncharacterized protein n=1 Tax=Mycena rosella TaxID=1033263 RepID=A0AAD7GIL0_MYCRO|nr:hypothetical protein B0H17DRAFT_1053590 [Mycena rosella]
MAAFHIIVGVDEKIKDRAGVIVVVIRLLVHLLGFRFSDCRRATLCPCGVVCFREKSSVVGYFSLVPLGALACLVFSACKRHKRSRSSQDDVGALGICELTNHRSEHDAQGPYLGGTGEEFRMYWAA